MFSIHNVCVLLLAFLQVFAARPGSDRLSKAINEGKFFCILLCPIQGTLILLTIWTFECLLQLQLLHRENEKCLNITPCDANCKLSNWEEWSSCSASCLDTLLIHFLEWRNLGSYLCKINFKTTLPTFLQAFMCASKPRK